MTLKLGILPIAAYMLCAFTSNRQLPNTAEAKPITSAAQKLPGTPTVTNIMAGQTIIAGTITVVEDRDLGTFTVTYQMNTGWYLKSAHLYVGTSEGIPVGNSGNPRPGQFPYKVNSFPAATQTWTAVISLAGLPEDVVVVAAHSTVQSASGTQTETGWGQGPQINDGGSWAMKFFHVIDVP
jgi:hypothetical protein